ncbi:unnamed protein product [Spirodela intermedia]|uniref:Uncharacterized protein n=1 Tax=Spirodela intermedia TaxID=51605 RepID=A0A7I8KWL8_SPIIN|nr:unnamed protein product [Spirodela intermedia]
MAAAGAAAGELSGRTVLELGASLVVLTAALLGASLAVLTDLPPLLPVLRVNAAANGVADRVQVRELVWGSAAGASPEETADVVLLSDVFYDPAAMAPLASTLRTVCREETRIWAASEVRESIYSCPDLLKEEGCRRSELPAVNRRLLRSPEESSEFAVFIISPPAPRGEGASDHKVPAKMPQLKST